MKITYWLMTAWLVSQNAMVLADDEAKIATEVTVQTGKIIQTTLRRYVKALGYVEPKPATAGKAAASSKIAAPVAGIVKQTDCEEGQAIPQGFVLFELDSRAADDLVAKAQVAVDFAQKNFTRKQQLNASENISRKLYDDAEQLLQTARKDLLTAQTQRALLKITAPLAGTVASCHVKVGEAVTLNAVLAEVIDVHRLDVALRVPSMEATALRLKQPVSVSVGSATVNGQVIFISSQVDPFTDTVLVRTSLPANAVLRTGQFVSAQIVVEERPHRLAVPIDSVVMRDKTALIALVNGNTAKQREVKLGLRDGNLIEIQGEGLREGMTIVTQGVYGLPTETRIRVVK
jgi:membrane fusion protein (multidrug efflux system)